MVSNLKKRLIPRNRLINSGAFFNLRCCAHILNHIVQDGLQLIGEILEELQSLVKWTTKSLSKDFYESVKKIFHLHVRKKGFWICKSVRIQLIKW